MRGEKEQYCLDIVKNCVFTKNGTPCNNPFTKKNFSEVTDEEWEEGRVLYINSDYYQYCFGLLEQDRKEFENILRIAQPNPNRSVFPDFIFPNGFIEHFQVTSSRENKKGSQHTKQMNQFEEKMRKEHSETMQDWNNTPSFDQVRSKLWVIQNPQHSHDFLIRSFEKNWEHHRNSLINYTGDTDIGVFLIEYSDIALRMIENIYANWINGMSQGDMRKQEKFTYYRLTRDKKLLEYIYQFRNQIRYVIFVYYKGIEIIKTENIPYLLKLMPWEYVIHPMDVITMSSLYNISIPAHFSEEMNAVITKLETLIQQLCPNGVEYKKLGECATMKRGGRVVKSQLSSDGQYPVYQNSLTPLGYYKKYNFPSDTTFIIGAGAAGDVGYSPNKFWAADNCWCFICPENLNNKYLYYVLMKEQDYLYSRVRKARIPRLSPIEVDKIKIPVPPLPVQEAIVRLLDIFTELTASQKQYEYCRDKLLTFEEKKAE